MGRLIPAGLAAAVFALLGLAGCSEPVPHEKTWIEIRAEKVGEFMAHLNNENIRERWRNDLIKIGQKSPDDRTYVLGECERAYAHSISRGGAGAGVLRANGRRRVMEVVAKLEATPVTKKLLRAGLEDVDEVRLAAAAALADMGDEAAVPVLLKTILAVPEGHAAHQIGIQALRRMAIPSRREVFLNALSSKSLELLTPVVLKTFPPQHQKKLQALRQVAGSHKNPYARVFALQRLVELKDPAVGELALRALGSKIAVLRPAALAALGAGGGKQAVQHLVRLLRKNRYPAECVAGLYKVGSQRALGAALELFGDDQLKSRTRAAVAQGFLAKLRDRKAPRPYRSRSARERALKVLRGALEDDSDRVVVAAVQGIGKLGGKSDVQALLNLLVDPSPKVAPHVVTALGHLGGEFAAAKLIDLLKNDSQLRPVAGEALGTFKDPKDVSVDTVIDLLEEEELSVRKAALSALLGLSRSKNARGFDPKADEVVRNRGVAKWRKWWKTRRGG